MLKTIAKSGIFSAIALGLMSFGSQVAVAAARCTANGQEVPCEELGEYAQGFVGLGIGFVLLMIAFGIWATIFWVLMIIHAAKHDIKDKAMWVILMVFTGLLGALIYYFVVKRKFVPQVAPPVSPSAPTAAL